MTKQTAQQAVAKTTRKVAETSDEQARGKKGRPNPVDVHVGERLRLRRTLLGMSQEKLAESVGLTFQQVQKYERGTNRVSASRLYQFSKILDTSVSYFFEQFSGDNAQTAPVYAFSDNEQEKFVNEEHLYDKETIELIRVYYQIQNPKVRKDIFRIIKSMAENLEEQG